MEEPDASLLHLNIESIEGIEAADMKAMLAKFGIPDEGDEPHRIGALVLAATRVHAEQVRVDGASWSAALVQESLLLSELGAVIEQAERASNEALMLDPSAANTTKAVVASQDARKAIAAAFEPLSLADATRQQNEYAKDISLQIERSVETADASAQNAADLWNKNDWEGLKAAWRKVLEIERAMPALVPYRQQIEQHAHLRDAIQQLADTAQQALDAIKAARVAVPPEPGFPQASNSEGNWTTLWSLLNPDRATLGASNTSLPTRTVAESDTWTLIWGILGRQAAPSDSPPSTEPADGDTGNWSALRDLLLRA